MTYKIITGDSKCLAILTMFLIAMILPQRARSQSAKASKKKPNIIFILVDDLGWKDLGTYGSSFYESPNIDQLAEEGMKFTDAYASSTVCSPSRSSIMTGQYPVHTGITDWIPGRQNTSGPLPTQALLPQEFTMNLPDSLETIAETLQKHDYTTFFAGKWHLGLNPSSWPKERGFDYNFGGWAAGSPSSGDMDGYFSPFQNPKLSDGPKGEFLTDRITSETIEFIRDEAKKDNPFFAFLSFYAVHTPLQSKDKYVEKFKEKARSLGLDTLKQFSDEGSSKGRARWMSGISTRLVQSNPVYAGLIYSVDENVGRIMKTLEQTGISEETIVVFTSDNGGLSTLPNPNAPTSNEPLHFGKGWAYEGGIRVPLIIKWPGHTKPGAVSRSPVINTDFYSTLLDMVGVPATDEQETDGVSMVPLLEGEESIDHPPLYWHYPHYHGGGQSPVSAMQDGKWKLIHFYNDQHVELYNLEEDIGEQNDLSAEFPERTAEMLYKLNQWRAETRAKTPEINPYYNPFYEEMIKEEDKTKSEFIKEYRTKFDEEAYKPRLGQKYSSPYDRLIEMIEEENK